MWFRNSAIQIRFDRELYCSVFFRQEGRLLALSHNPPDPTLARPSHFIAVEGQEVLDFYVDYRNIGLSEVRGRFGPGKRLKITGLGESEDNVLIEKTMVVELYQAYPDIATIWAVYRNPDLERPIRITRITNQFFRMDASLTDPRVPRHGLQCFYLDQPVHGEATAPLLDLDFARTVTTDSPGFARVAFWNRVMGMTVASRPPAAGTLTIPLETARDRRVEVSFRHDLDRILEPGEQLVGPKGFVMVYRGDYRSGLAREKAMRGGFPVKAALIRIGNSRGIRIPKVLLERYGFKDEVELEPRQDHLVIRAATPTRAGWDDAFRRMGRHGDDALLDAEYPSPARWDTTEWKW